MFCLVTFKRPPGTALQQQHLSGIKMGDLYRLFMLFAKWRLIILWEGRLVKGFCGFWNNQQIPTEKKIFDWGLLKLMPRLNTEIISDGQCFQRDHCFSGQSKVNTGRAERVEKDKTTNIKWL